jgi:hypothetical protein
MKKNITILFFVLWNVISFGQIDLGTIFDGGSVDTQTFMEGYLKPFTAGFGNGINGGWYTTAKTHKFLGIDIAVIANVAFVPKSDETFTFKNSDYINIKLFDGSASAELPTIFGSQALGDRPLLTFSDTDGSVITSASTLPGSGLKESIGFNVVPSAMVQLGVGLFKNTDLKIRFIPKQTTDDYEFSTFGIGVMHDLKQWIPFVKRLPFDFSALVAWNDMKSKFIVDSENFQSNQVLEFNTQTFLFQLLASKKLSILTLYGGVGATSYNTDVDILGTYTTSENVYVNPVSLNSKGNSMRANLGLSIKLFFLNLSADYALQEYDTFTVSAGFSIR